MFIRNLTFETDNIGTDVTLMLCFHKLDAGKLAHSQLAWRVSTFASQGHQRMDVTYKSQLMFSRAQVDNDNIVSAATWREIDLGKTMSLKKEGETNSYYFTTPTTAQGAGQTISVLNDTGLPQNIGIGFVNNSEPNNSLVFQKVGNKQTVKAEYTPTLMAYVTSDYQQNEVIKADIEGMIWQKDLTSLDEKTVWTLYKDKQSGEYKITQKSDVSVKAVEIPKHGKVMRAWLNPTQKSSDNCAKFLLTLLGALKPIVQSLVDNRYRMKVILKAEKNNTMSARLDITVPKDAKFPAVEEDLRVAIGCQSKMTFDPVRDVEAHLLIGEQLGTVQWVGFGKFTAAFVTA